MENYFKNWCYLLLFIFVSMDAINSRAETLSEKIANSDRIYFVKLTPAKMLVQFKNYNQSPLDFTPAFFKDKINPLEIVTFQSATSEMKFLYEKDVDQAYVDKINTKIVEYLYTFIAKEKLEIISPENFREDFALNSVYIQPEMKDFVFIEHTNNEEFHYVSVNSFKADFGINLYEVNPDSKKKKIVSSSGSAPIIKKSFGRMGQADNVQKTKAINELLQDYFYSVEVDFLWHLERFQKEVEKNLRK